MQEQDVKNTIKAIDAMLAGWAAMARSVLDENVQQSANAFDTAPNALALVQLKEYFNGISLMRLENAGFKKK